MKIKELEILDYLEVMNCNLDQEAIESLLGTEAKNRISNPSELAEYLEENESERHFSEFVADQQIRQPGSIHRGKVFHGQPE